MATTTSEVVTFDGVILNTLAWNISTGSGRGMIPALRGDNVVLPGRSGYIPALNRPTEAGDAIWKMWVQGCDLDGRVPQSATLRQQYHMNREKLISLFTRRTSLSTATVRQPDGTVRTAKCWVQEAIDFSEMAGRTRGEFSIALSIPDVYWTDTQDISQTTLVTTGLPKTLSLTNFAGGHGPIDDASFRVVGPVSNPRITDSENGSWVQYNGTLSSGAVWIVDSAKFTSTVNGVSVLAATTHAGHVRFVSISPRSATGLVPQVVLTGTGGNSLTSLTVTGRRKYYTA